MTAEPLLSGCTPQFCSLSLREDDSMAVQLGHAGRDGPGAEQRLGSPLPTLNLKSLQPQKCWYLLAGCEKGQQNT